MQIGLGIPVSSPVSGVNPNLLTFTEQFDNAAWAKISGATVVADNVADPLGGTTADTVDSPGTGAGVAQTSSRAATTGAAVLADHSIDATLTRYSVSGTFDSAAYTYSAWLKAVSGPTVTVRLTIGRAGGFLQVAARDQDGGIQFAIWGAKLEVGSVPTGDGTNYGVNP